MHLVRVGDCPLTLATPPHTSSSLGTALPHGVSANWGALRGASVLLMCFQGGQSHVTRSLGLAHKVTEFFLQHVMVHCRSSGMMVSTSRGVRSHRHHFLNV